MKNRNLLFEMIFTSRSKRELSMLCQIESEKCQNSIVHIRNNYYFLSLFEFKLVKIKYKKILK